MPTGYATLKFPFPVDPAWEICQRECKSGISHGLKCNGKRGAMAIPSIGGGDDPKVEWWVGVSGAKSGALGKKHPSLVILLISIVKQFALRQVERLNPGTNSAKRRM